MVAGDAPNPGFETSGSPAKKQARGQTAGLVAILPPEAAITSNLQTHGARALSPRSVGGFTSCLPVKLVVPGRAISQADLRFAAWSREAYVFEHASTLADNWSAVNSRGWQT